jgi:hypothetical protein
MLVELEHVNATEGVHISEPYIEVYGGVKTIGDVYRMMLSEYGRCLGKIYVDTTVSVKDHGCGAHPETKTIAIGWTFLKRQRYDDDPTRSFLLETWVTLLKSRPQLVYDYQELPNA